MNTYLELLERLKGKLPIIPMLSGKLIVKAEQTKPNSRADIRQCVRESKRKLKIKYAEDK
jgi:hypothetical protein